MNHPTSAGRPPSQDGRPFRAALLLCAALALLVAARGLLVVSLADVFFYGEELAKGAAGAAMLADLGVEHHRLAYLYYEGGGFVISHLDALAFLVVGQNVLALKLVAMGCTALILCAGYCLAQHHFGRRAAVVFALLFVFAPKGFQKLSLLALGIHFEALFFVLLVLHLSARALFDEDARARTWVALGLASGFGIYFSYSVAPAVAYSGVALLFLRPALLGRRIHLGIGGFLIGFAPWIWTWSKVGAGMFDIHGQELVGSAGDVSALAMVGSHLRELFAARDAVDWLAMLTLPVVAAAGVLFRPRGRALFLGGYLLVFLGVYFLSGFAEPRLLYYFNLKRLSQPWVLVTLLAAVSIARWTEGTRPRLRAVGWAAAGLLLIAGVMDTAETVRAAPPTGLKQSARLLLRVKGFYWTGYVRALESHIEGTRDQKLETLARLPDGDHGYLYPVIAERLFRDGQGEYDALVRSLRVVAPEGWQAFLQGLGVWWQAKHGAAGLAQAFAAVEALEYSQRRPVREAIARRAIGYRVDRPGVERQLERVRAQGLPDEYVRMLGYGMHLALGWGREGGRGLGQDMPPLIFDPAAAAAFIEAQEPRVAELLEQGWQEALRDRTLP